MTMKANGAEAENRDDRARDDIYRSNPTSADMEDARIAFRYRTFKCPRCGTDLSATKAEVGKTLVCPDCDSEVVVPDYLDFDTETDYERHYFNEEKRRRDELYSPLRNPNRVGVDLTGPGLYGLQGEELVNEKKEDVYYPVRCRICETLMQAPASMLGKTIVCPDCGTATIVTDALKSQQSATEVTFEPRDRGVYDIGATPEAPDVAIQGRDGTTRLVGKKDDVAAPSGELRSAFERKKRVERASKVDDEEDGKVERLERQLRAESSSGFLATLLRRRARRRKATEDEEEDLTRYLPPQVLRRKNGELVWTFASPPKLAPLFNGTFRAVFSEDIWTRGAILAIIVAAISFFVSCWLPEGTRLSTVERGSLSGVAGDTTLLIAWSIIGPLGLAASAFMGLYFWSIYNAGNSGASRVVEWRKEDIVGFFGYGFWFAITLSLAFLPGLILQSLCGWGAEGNLNEVWTGERESIGGLLRSSAICFGSFWLFFPIFWLSTIQTDWPFCPISWNVFTSFISKFFVWIQFYLTTAFVFYLPTVLWGATVDLPIFWFVAPVVLLLIPIFYGLLLGRLSWILDDEIRSVDFDD